MENTRIFKNDTIILTLVYMRGYWLYDKTRGMNLAMSAKTEQDAFVEALMYYQERLNLVEGRLSSLQLKVDTFIRELVED